MTGILGSPEATTAPGPCADRPGIHPVTPAALVDTVTTWLATNGNPVDGETANPTTAYIAAATLLFALGADVDLGTDDSLAARLVRETLLEAGTRTTTRSRRAL
jgi:hypothetical protein